MTLDGASDTSFDLIGNRLQLSNDRDRSPRFEVNPDGKILNLNNDVVVDGEEVVCRHFAYAYYSADNKLDFLESAATREGITSYFTGRLGTFDQDFRSIVRKAAPERKYLIHCEYLGVLLANLIDSMTRQNVRHVDALVLSQGHASALAVGNYPEDAGAGRQFVITAYDPDDTGKHKSGYFADRNAVASLPFKWFFPQGLGTGEKYLTSILDFDVAREHDKNYGVANHQTTSQAEILCMALRTGVPDVVHNLQTSGIEEGEAACLEVAQARTLRGDPALFFALKDGHFSVLAPYGELLQHLSLEQENLMAVLKAKTSDGVPVLTAAITYATKEAGNAAATPDEIVAAYASFVTMLGLDHAKLKQLAWAADNDGVTLRDLHRDAFDQYVQQTGITESPF
jgi:hypothetical protein